MHCSDSVSETSVVHNTKVILIQALRMIHTQSPNLIKNLKTQCGSCSALGTHIDLQLALIEAYTLV